MKQLYRNISFTGVSQLLYTAMAFLLVPFVARYLKSDGYGIYNLAGILGFFFNLLSDLGASTLLTIEISKNRRIAPRLFAAALGLKLMLILPAVLVIFAYLHLSNLSDSITQAVWIFTASSLFAGISSSFFAVFRGFQRMEFETIGTLLDKGLSVFLGIFLLVQGFGIDVFLLSFVAAELLKFSICLYFLRARFFPLSIDVRPKRIKIVFIKGLPFGLSVFLAICYNYTAILMLSSFSTMKQVGLYSAGFKFLNLATILPTVLATAFLPQLAQCERASKRLTLLFGEGLKYLLFVAIPMVPFVVHFSGLFIDIIFGNDFTESATFLRILVWGAFAQMVNIFMVSLYSAVGKQKMIVYFQSAALMINILMNYFLITTFQAVGASAATVITEWLIFSAAVYYAFTRLIDTHTLSQQLIPYILKISFASLVMYFAAVLLYPNRMAPIPAMVVCIFTYLASAQVTGAMGLKRFMVRLFHQDDERSI